MIFLESISRLLNILHRPISFLEGVYGTILVCILNSEEKEKLGLRMYNNAKRSYRGKTLHDWERKWFTGSLPAPPSKVLVAACGAGRELKELLEMGYEVKGFDGSESMVSECRARLPEVEVFLSTFREFEINNQSSKQKEYDAVLIGWGSIMHLYDKKSLNSFFTTLNAVCPQGPILFSGQLSRDGKNLSQSRSAKTGRLLATGICKVLRRSTNNLEFDYFTVREGFLKLHHYSDFVELADKLDRVVESHNYDYPCITLQKKME